MNVIELVAPAASTTVTVNVDVPVALGALPPMAPVEEFSVTQAGAPVIDHVKPAVPVAPVVIATLSVLFFFTVPELGVMTGAGLMARV